MKEEKHVERNLRKARSKELFRRRVRAQLAAARRENERLWQQAFDLLDEMKSSLQEVQNELDKRRKRWIAASPDDPPPDEIEVTMEIKPKKEGG